MSVAGLKRPLMAFQAAALLLCGCVAPRPIGVEPNLKPPAIQQSTQRPVIMDVDTGRDDAWAILAAMRRHQPDALIASYGNTTLANTVRNTLDIVALGASGTDVRPPVWRGEDQPLLPAPRSSLDEIARRAQNNGNGLVNVTLPPSGLSTVNGTGPWVTQVADFIRKEKQVDFVMMGPATDLARLIDAFGKEKDGTPIITRYVRNVVAMGGSMEPGLAVDFNFQADPQAAQKVITTFGKNLTLVPYDLTRQLALTQEEVAQLRGRDRQAETTRTIMQAQANWPSNTSHRVLLHDPATLLVLDNAIGRNVMKVRVALDEPTPGTGAPLPGKLLLDPNGTAVSVATIPPEQITAVRNRLVRDYFRLEAADNR